MEIEYLRYNGTTIAQITDSELTITNAADALDLMMTCRHEGAEALILREEQIVPEFFALQTQLAGDIMQKLVNYQMTMAILGDFTVVESESLQALITECNQRGPVYFVETMEEAYTVLQPQ